MVKDKVLVVDDEQLIRWTLSEALRSWHYEPLEAATASAALTLFENEQPAAVLLDINLPDGSGLDVLREIKQRHPQAVVIMITANVLVDDTIAALRGGAYDFIGKPINLEDLQITIRNGIETQRLRKEVTQIRSEQVREFSFDRIIGQSPTMLHTLTLARKVSTSDVSSVLLQGESGTGKDVIAKAIHYSSQRFQKPFVAINCAAIPANLIESELFGYEKGAFTDAKNRKEGLIEQAEGGTLFLDEIGELELNLQAKLLRVLEEGTFRRVGGLKDIPFNTRIIAASNRDLKTETQNGHFRTDLFYRLSVIQIDVPPLCERGDDIMLLTHFFISHFKDQLRKRIKGLSPEVAQIFQKYPWPGNVRELRNVIERVMILEDGEIITTTYLPRDLMANFQTVPAKPSQTKPQKDVSNHSNKELFQLPSNGVSIDEVENSLVRQAIARSGGNQTQAAKLLGISRDQLRYRLKKLEEPPSSIPA